MDVAGAWTHPSRSNAGGIPLAQRRGNAPLVALGLALAALGALGLGSLLGSAPPASNHAAVEAESNLAKLPLSFEAYRGQASARVDFVARSAAGSIVVGAGGARLSLPGSTGRPRMLSFSLQNSLAARPQALGPLPGKVNYLIGDDRAAWRTGIPTFARVRYAGVWPGVDVDWHGDGRQLEYDFRLAPGIEPSAIRMRLAGAREVRVAANDDLLISVGGETVRQRAPIAYQPSGGGRDPVPASFKVKGNRVGFQLGPHDPARPLIIDPTLVYSTYLGGDDVDQAGGIAVDSTGAAYVTGRTFSTDFNQVGQIEGNSAIDDVFVSKLNPAGNALVYSTYVGGDASDAGNAIAVDSAGAAYLTGQTDSTDFNTVGSIEGDSAGTDAFVSKLTPAGSGLAYSTYLGGDSSDNGVGIAVDSAGAAYVTGETGSGDFCTGAGCSIEGDSVGTDAFVSKLTPAGSGLAYSTYLGGDASDLGNGLAVDSAGAAYVTGQTDSADYCTACSIEGPDDNFDAFVSKLTPAGSGLAYSTYLGGNGADLGFAIALDSTGAAYLTGQTESTDFNTVNPIEGNSALDDAFVSKLTPAGSALAYSTYLGGNGSDIGGAIAVDSGGAALVTGQTISTDFNTVDPIEGDSAMADAFISKLTPAGNALADSTYLGGDGIDSGFGIAVDSTGAAHVAGSTSSTDFETRGQIEGNSVGQDAFVSKLAEPPTVVPGPSGPTPSGPTPSGPAPRGSTPNGRCAGRTVTQTGTAGPDVITGTRGPDVIAALGGNDLVRGLGGSDLICGDAGRDRLRGGKGKDRLLGQAGRDRLAGGKGRDKLKGGGGKDRLSGGAQRDVCVGGRGKDLAQACERRRSI
jgi:Ca2+-binding RTX toxin-like protein